MKFYSKSWYMFVIYNVHNKNDHTKTVHLKGNYNSIPKNYSYVRFEGFDVHLRFFLVHLYNYYSHKMMRIILSVVGIFHFLLRFHTKCIQNIYFISLRVRFCTSVNSCNEKSWMKKCNQIKTDIQLKEKYQHSCFLQGFSH